VSWPDDVRTIDPDHAEELVDVFGKVGGGVAVGRRRGTAHAAQVDGDHGEAFCQPRHEPPPLEPVLGEPVEKYQGGAASPTDRSRRLGEGLAPGAIETVNKGVQLSAIRDPDGNTLTFIGDFRVQY
jgi:hypothetical protein